LRGRDHWEDLGVDGREKLNGVRGMDWIVLALGRAGGGAR
jgi:hypothetical protein